MLNNGLTKFDELYPNFCPSCNSPEMLDCDEIINPPFGVTEFKVICKNCGTLLALWSYGCYIYII